MRKLQRRCRRGRGDAGVHRRSLGRVGARHALGRGPKNCAFTLRIGDVLPFTGDLAAYGGEPRPRRQGRRSTSQNAALEAAGLAKRDQVELVGSEDGQTQASASVEAATKLIKSNRART